MVCRVSLVEVTRGSFLLLLSLALSSEMSLCPVAETWLRSVSIRDGLQEKPRVLASFAHSGLSLTRTWAGYAHW